MAVKQVFNITELLEAVLLRLPLKDILKAKAVTRRWKEIIDTSVSLRRTTYTLATEDVVRPVKRHQTVKSCPENAPFTAHESFETILFFEEQRCKVRENGKETPRPWQHWIIDCSGKKLCFKGHTFTMESEADGRMRMPTAFHAMYLTQPPVSAVLLIGPDSRFNEGRITVYKSSGITFECIEQVVQNILKNALPGHEHARSDGLLHFTCMLATRT